MTFLKIITKKLNAHCSFDNQKIIFNFYFMQYKKLEYLNVFISKSSLLLTPTLLIRVGELILFTDHLLRCIF